MPKKTIFEISGRSSTEAIYENFFKPVLEEIDSTKKKTKLCIECFEKTAFPKDNTFMVDTADDVKRKKSYFRKCQIIKNHRL